MINHPITPPAELVEQWIEQGVSRPPSTDYMTWFAAQAARWGADQELEACCQWLDWQKLATHQHLIAYLRLARRPKPPSRKEQALEAIGRLCASVIHDDLKNDAATIRRALEGLDD